MHTHLLLRPVVAMQCQGGVTRSRVLVMCVLASVLSTDRAPVRGAESPDPQECKVELSKPVIVAMAPPEAQGWGPYQFPGLSRLPDGRIQITFHIETDSATSYGLPRTRAASADDGETWTLLPREAGAGGTAISESPQLPLPNGDLLAVKRLNSKKASDLILPEMPFAEAISYSNVVSLYRVEDLKPECTAGWMLYRLPAGQTEWVEEQATVHLPGELRAQREGVLVFAAFQEMYVAPDGALWAVNSEFREFGVIDGRSQAKHGVIILRSADNGKTWKLWGEIPYVGDPAADPMWADKRIGFTEPVVNFMPDGSVLSLLRTQDGQGPYSPTPDGQGPGPSYWSRSTDNGKTWSRPAVFDQVGSGAQIRTLKNGVTLASYGKPGLYIRASTDPAGLRWQKRITLTRFLAEGDLGGNTCGCPALLPLNDNTALLAYSELNPKGILVRKVTVTSVGASELPNK